MIAKIQVGGGKQTSEHWIHCFLKFAYRRLKIPAHPYMFILKHKHLEDIHQTIPGDEIVVNSYFVFFTFWMLVLQLLSIIKVFDPFPHATPPSHYSSPILVKFLISHFLLNLPQPSFQPHHSTEVVHKTSAKIIFIYSQTQ